MRTYVKRHGWRRLMAIVLVPFLGSALIAGIKTVLTDQVSGAGKAAVATLVGGDEARSVPLRLGDAPLVATVTTGGMCEPGTGRLVRDEGAASRIPGEKLNSPSTGPFLSASAEVLLQGTSAQAVLLKNMRVVVDLRSPPTGVIVAQRSECGGGVDSRPFEVDIEPGGAKLTPKAGRKLLRPGVAPPPNVVVEDGLSGRSYAVEPVEFPFAVTMSDPELFDITASVTTCDCLWHLELDWQSAGRTGTAVINNSGKPFRTSSAPFLRCDIRSKPIKCGT
ncbi:hypothetical protein [Longispora fulva]|uniref:Uncharacterized protein n=1 Tax=Longispora fulva TaxID=619741 RepID=A0A8J7GHJ5_9ACTN|nr:hypothetical protein [Longispora fulva]MBG6136732.1 hypothetical protein [Longispora fulva]